MPVALSEQATRMPSSAEMPGLDPQEMPELGATALQGALGGNVQAGLRDFEGIVSAETESWLKGAWDRAEKDPANAHTPETKLKQREMQVANFKSLSEQLDVLGGEPTERMEDFIRTFGIANFGRYNPDRLFDQYTYWISGNVDSFDTLFIVARDGDFNYAYNNVTGPFDSPDGTNTLVFETDNNSENLGKIARKVASTGAEIRTTVLSAHGTDDGEIPDLGINAKTDLSDFAKNLKLLSLKFIPDVILDSCLTGWDEGAKESIGQAMSRSMEGVYVVAPNKVIMQTLRDKNGHVSFTNETSDGGTVVYKPETGEERIITNIHGDLLKPKVRVYKNGQRVETTRSSKYEPSRVHLMRTRSTTKPAPGQ